MTNLEQKLISNQKITKNDIKEYINNFAREYRIKIGDITFNNNRSLGSFDFKNNNININYDLINKYYTYSNDINIFNKEIVLCIFHELTHAIQKIQVFDNETYIKYPTYYVMLISNYFSIINNNDFYNNNHNNFSMEYTANICSYINTINLLKKHNIDYKIIEENYNEYVKLYNSFDFSKNIPNDSLLNDIAKSNIRNDILFKYKHALHNYNREENLNDIDYEIYGYKK